MEWRNQGITCSTVTLPEPQLFFFCFFQIITACSLWSLSYFVFLSQPWYNKTLTQVTCDSVWVCSGTTLTYLALTFLRMLRFSMKDCPSFLCVTFCSASSSWLMYSPLLPLQVKHTTKTIHAPVDSGRMREVNTKYFFFGLQVKNWITHHDGRI